MFQPKSAFSGYSVKDLEKTKRFYGDVLGLKVDDDGSGMGVTVHLPGGTYVFLYPKDDHEAASFTVLNFEVDNIDKAVDALKSKGIQFERYEHLPSDEKGIMRGLAENQGPDIAWFKDPAGNVLSVLQGE